MNAAPQRTSELDELRVFRSDRPVESRDAALPVGQPLEGCEPLWMRADPLRTFGDEQHDSVGGVDGCGNVLRLLVGVDGRDGQIRHFGEHLRKNAGSRSKFVGVPRVAVRAL